MLYPDINELMACKSRKPVFVHPAYRSVKSKVSGNHSSPFRGRGLEFDSVREYVPGDDIRNIDWRVTARTGSPHLKLFREDRERQIVICVDMNASMRFGTRKTFKSVQAARAAALLAWQGIAQQDRVGVCLFGDVPDGVQLYAPKRARKPLCAALKMISEPPIEHHAVSLENALQHVSQTVQAGSIVYLISDFMDIGTHLQDDVGLNRINKKCDVVFIAVNDQSDKAIYPVGTIGFCTHHAEKVHVNTDSIAGRERYAAQWKENRQRLYESTTRLKIPLIELSTESDIHRELVLGLNDIKKKKRRVPLC